MRHLSQVSITLVQSTITAPGRGLGSEFGAYLVPSMDAVGLTGQHHITNVLIQLRGTMADVESYFIAYHPHMVDGAARLAFVAGRYLDVFECRDGAWKISDRRVVIDISRAFVSGEDWPERPRSLSAGGERQTPLRCFSSVGRVTIGRMRTGMIIWTRK